MLLFMLLSNWRINNIMILERKVFGTLAGFLLCQRATLPQPLLSLVSSFQFKKLGTMYRQETLQHCVIDKRPFVTPAM